MLDEISTDNEEVELKKFAHGNDSGNGGLSKPRPASSPPDIE
jgi:hypothetical protein